ncbi:MAG: hypothetical protein KatS3mg131_3522 [Candidatus Tectimicrobiota bacterium]|nr:MAG: hypothetical protein KatS3mg131_3522 [Candidatus Tectomicrobia bacterium]
MSLRIILLSVVLGVAAGVSAAPETLIDDTTPGFFNQALSPEQHLVLHEDHGGATGYRVPAKPLSVPEPHTLLLVGTGLLGIGYRLWRRGQAPAPRC